MKITTAAFDTENAKTDGREPVFLLEWTGLTRKYCSGSFKNITANHKTLIQDVSFSATSITLPNNNPKIGKAVFTILNEALDVSDFLTQNNVHEVDCKISFGFTPIDDTDFISWDHWRVTDIDPKSTGDVIILTLRDASILAARDIFVFEQKTALDGDATTPQQTLTVDLTTGFIDPATNIPSEIREYIDTGVQVRSTSIAYPNIDSATQFGTSPGNVMTPIGAPQESLDDGEEVNQMIAIQTENDKGQGGMIQLFVLHVLLTTDDASGHAYYDLTRLDTGFKGFGVGLLDTEVDIDQIENVAGLLQVNSIPFGVVGGNPGIPERTAGEPQNALIFLAQLLNSFGAFFAYRQ